LAWRILHNDLVVPAGQARRLLVRSITAALDCAISMNERVQQTEVYERARSVKRAFERLSHCAKRSPAGLRRLLDEKFSSLLQGGEVDLETIEALYRASREGFEQFPDSEPAATALSALGVYRKFGYDTIGLAADFSSLSPLIQANCTSALSQALRGGVA